MQNRPDGRDRASTANRCARRYQIRSSSADCKQLSYSQTNEHRKRDSQKGIEKSAFPRFQYLMQIHPETKRHNRGLQQEFRERFAVGGIRVRNRKSKNNSRAQRNGRRNKSRGRQNQQNEKNYFGIHSCGVVD